MFDARTLLHRPTQVAFFIKLTAILNLSLFYFSEIRPPPLIFHLNSRTFGCINPSYDS
jgi:hypothetical protein